MYAARASLEGLRAQAERARRDSTERRPLFPRPRLFASSPLALLAPAPVFAPADRGTTEFSALLTRSTLARHSFSAPRRLTRAQKRSTNNHRSRSLAAATETTTPQAPPNRHIFERERESTTTMKLFMAAVALLALTGSASGESF